MNSRRRMGLPQGNDHELSVAGLGADFSRAPQRTAATQVQVGFIFDRGKAVSRSRHVGYALKADVKLASAAIASAG